MAIVLRRCPYYIEGVYKKEKKFATGLGSFYVIILTASRRCNIKCHQAVNIFVVLSKFSACILESLSCGKFLLMISRYTMLIRTKYFIKKVFIKNSNMVNYSGSYFTIT
mgnify:CR=1 FL=1